MSLDLTRLGWSPSREEEFRLYAVEGLAAARVAAQHRGAYVVYTDGGEEPAELSGRLRHAATGPRDLPVVGDWTAVRENRGSGSATINAVLERQSAFSRKAAGDTTREQLVAANVDVVFIVSSFGGDLNVRRLERYLAAGWESGAQPVVVLNKSDLADDPAAAVAEMESVAFGVPVHPVSCLEGTGVVELSSYVAGNRTGALLGSSGVGKSSLLNRLLGRERQKVKDVRGDGRGRHTTTHRELVPLPSGGFILDTPGMRELGLWDAGTGVEGAFADLGALAAECRFRDCRHEHEPGCAVLGAVAAGRLDAERLESYRKLVRELHHLELKQDDRLRAEARRERRRFARSLRKASW